MKLSVITDEISQDLAEAVQIAARYGMDAIELRTAWNKQPHELTDADVETVRRLCAENGLRVCAISSPFFKCEFTQEEIERQITLLQKTISVARRLECRIIRGFSFWQGDDFDDILPRLARAFEQPAKMLAAADMVLVLEPDPAVYACNGSRVARLVQAVGSPCIRALWDAGNDIYSPVPERPFPEGYQTIRPYMAHMHLKDAVLVNGEPRCVKLGEGIVNWPAHLDALKRDGYSGYMSLETHYRKDAELSEELMRLPGGSAFSRGARAASEECMEALRQMLCTMENGREMAK